ncbi:MAG: Gfo/Idh/MocA family oxidoreductase [Chloroflexota bacterium]|nr:Gfo/Idh/MocA family oxidoreductase [Chloroflexota bacterium]
MSDRHDTPRPIRLGIIGTGLAVEQLHWPALVRMPERFIIAAFANHSQPKAERFAHYSGASMADYHADYHDLLRRDDVEAVLISLPIPLNYSVTRDCLAAGKHVICEKPTGVDEEEGRAFVALQSAFPERTALIAENCFYRDDLRLARSLLDANAIGRVHLMTWRMVNQVVPVPGRFSSTPWRHHPTYRGGAHLDGGVHHTAQIRMLCGGVRQLSGAIQTANTTIDAPSDLTLTLWFAGGAIGNYTACYPDIPVPPESNEMRLYGTEGILTLNGQATSRQVAIHRPDGSIEEHRFDEIDSGYYGEFLNFYEAIVHDAPVIATIEQNFQNMLIILRGLDSAEQGRVLDLDEASGVPLWRPYGASGLFDGLPGHYTTEMRQKTSQG